VDSRTSIPIIFKVGEGLRFSECTRASSTAAVVLIVLLLQNHTWRDSVV